MTSEKEKIREKVIEEHPNCYGYSLADELIDLAIEKTTKAIFDDIGAEIGISEEILNNIKKKWCDMKNERKKIDS